MKAWQINIIVLVVVFVIVYFLPGSAKESVGALVAIASAIWVGIDSKKLGIQNYKKTVLSLSSTPSGSSAVVLLIWPVAFPMYISWRQRVKAGKIPLKEASAALNDQ